MSNPALDTLMLAFSSDGGLAVPDRALVIGAEPVGRMITWPDVVGWQPLKTKAEAWERSGFSLTDDLGDERWPVVIVLPGKSKDETLAWFALARDHLAPGGTMVVAMPNSAGAGRFEKNLRQATGETRSITKNKCRAFFAVDDGSWNEEVFGQWREDGKRRAIPETDYVVDPGVFSAKGVDPGSAFLMEHLPHTIRGNVADLGAGWGYLSAELLKRFPDVSRIDMFEVDSRALDCAKANVEPLAGDRVVRFHWQDVTLGIKRRYDTIVMNPPFHTGQMKDLTLGLAFLEVAADSLVKRGKLFIVANRQLPYEAALKEIRLPWSIVAENPTYKILLVENK